MISNLHRNHAWQQSGLLYQAPDILELAQKYVRMRDNGTITPQEFETLIQIILSNYVEQEVINKVEDLFSDKLTDLFTTAYA